MLSRIESFLLNLAAIAVIGLGLLITTSVLLRATLNSGIPTRSTWVRELMVAAIVLPLAATAAARANIVVEVLSERLSPLTQDWLVVLGSVVGLFALAPLIWAGWNEAVHTLESGSYFFGQLSLPKWPGRVIFLFGVAFCWLRLAIQVVGDIRTIRSGGRVLTGLPTHSPHEEV
ncbi:LOW QUALITY PROTEIN: TRAP-type C4-dicarboxylate transport system, small permease component [Limimaricola cinnabarinus LL-001]|uniref:TRAP transporter small permease protein n=1 Tax=Limimaricola cinnabarinus LL-001 TaxID=1337093 RepID=U2Z4E6_9RHOB|nr:LOW QUALITY PROTEIN: TRAP-type C4-dicarboxylate transport system, small permease component [Limimaricola cinnabarinus LL-001]